MPRVKSDKVSRRARILIPELLNLILVHLDRSDYAKLVSVSRHWFYSVAPLLWQNVTGLTRLFSLVPNTKVTVKRKAGMTISERIVAVDIPRRADFDRFEFYANFVKTLDIRDIYKFQGEKEVRAYCASRKHSLLPNLASLTCRYKRSPTPLVMLGWIDWVSSTSLLKLSMVRDAPSFWGSTANTKDGFVYSLLELVGSRCPDLQQIEIPSCDSMPRKSSATESIVSRMSLVRQLSLLLPTLRVVSGTESFLDPQNLGILGELPCLETLKINAQYCEPPSIVLEEMQWPVSCFLALRHLHLVAVRLDTLEFLWNFECLVRPLVTLEIETGTQGRSTMLCSAAGAFIVDFIRNISSRSPHITNLDCRLHACSLFCNRCAPARLSFPELGSLTALPLQRLSLQRIWLAENISHSHLIHAIPQVRTIQLLDVSLTLEDLHHYAVHLPRLKYLCCTLFDSRLERESSLIENPTMGPVPTARQAISLDLKLPQLTPSESPLHGDQILFLARYIRHLWPMAHCFSTDKKFEPVCRRINKLLLKYR